MWNSLRTRLTIIFISLAIGPLLLVGAILAQRSFAFEQEQALDLQQQVAQRVSTAITAFFQEVENDLSSLSTEIRNLEQPDRAQQISLLLGAFSSGAYRNVYEEFAWLDAQGQEQVRVSRQDVFTGDELISRADAPEFTQPRDTREIYYSSVWFDERSGKPLITMAIPLSEPRSVQLNSVLVATLRFSAVSDLLAELQVGDEQVVYVVTQSNQVIAHENIGQVSPETTILLPEQAGVQTGLNNQDDVVGIAQLRLGTQTLRAVAETSTAAALSLARSVVNTLAIVIFITLIVATAVSLLAARQIVRPVEDLLTTAERVTAGDFSQQVTTIGRDEIGKLGIAFNAMTTQLRNLIGNLEQRVHDRTRALETSTRVSRRLSTILDTEKLVQKWSCKFKALLTTIMCISIW
ncbi:MAG: HAMP domain-containing protein [Chloroflexota bacterium]